MRRLVWAFTVCLCLTKRVILYAYWVKMKKKKQKKLEDLKVLGRSPDLLNNFKTGQGQVQLIMKRILFYHNMGVAAILVQ